MVYANINSTEEDFSFLVTALYHWETLYPTFTLLLPTDPNQIVVKAPKEESKKDSIPVAAPEGSIPEEASVSKSPAPVILSE